MTDLKQGIGRIVCVLGEAGLGKTRLVTETTKVFKDLISSNGDWYETISLSYETNQAYGLFQRLMRRVNGIAYDDPPSVIRERLATIVGSLAEERRPGATQVFEALFGLECENGGTPLEGETFKQEMFTAMYTWWRAHFSSRPTVLVFDDMHWSDATSIELLRQLLPLTEEIPLVLICALRTERQSPAWQIKTTADEEFHHRYTEISLHPLSEAESNELLNRLLAIADLPDRLRASILEKSGGNPFFIEEVVRSLIESGAVVCEDRTTDGVTQRYWRATIEGADFDIPNNLQSLLAARTDRLEEATRATLQMASVIGRSFFYRVLLAVDEASQELDKHLGTLIRLDMIREAARVPEVEYTFPNPLTQEAVYNTILLKRRRGFHRRVGEAIEALYPDRLEGFFGLLAHHFSLGGQPDKAIGYYQQASRQAIAVFAYDEAAQNLHAALELLDAGEKSAIHMTLFEELAEVNRLLRDFAQAISLYRQALDVWHDLADGEEIIAVRLHRKIVQMATEAKWNIDLENYRHASQIALESRASLEQSLATLQNGEAHPEIVRALATLSFDAWRNQIPPDWERAQCYAQQAVDMAEQLDNPVVLSRALGALANVLDGRSLLREHLQVAQRRLEISQKARLDDPSEGIDALSGVGMALMYVGEYTQAMPYLQQAEALAANMQAIGQQAAALGLQGQCWYRLDRWDEVFATEERWRDLERRYTRQRVGAT
jgi:predicted ATPase